MTSDQSYAEAYVWIWLPKATEPVVAGRISRDSNKYIFNYGRSYLERRNAIPVYDKELPLQPGEIAPLSGLSMAGCLRDAAPDAWGRRVILNRKFAGFSKQTDPDQLDELVYLLESGSDRTGALDFQQSATKYVARQEQSVALEELVNAAHLVEKGQPITPALEQALFHGTSIGGARPKATIESDDKKCIAKFSSQTDIYNVVKSEFMAMRLASHAGLNVAPVRLEHSTGKDVLLVERFDRIREPAGWRRKAMVSALTLLELDEMMARYASYETLAEIIRHRFSQPKENLAELFRRLTFNILCGNTDDHARNHAAFWNGESLTLTPAYDICPQSRTGSEASQAMLIHDNIRRSQLRSCLNAAHLFLLKRQQAHDIILNQIQTIKEYWPEVCEEAALTKVDRDLLWRRQFLNPYIFEGAPEAFTTLAAA